MTGLNFSFDGTRWRLALITPAMVAQPHVPPLPGVGLLFSADDGQTRFLGLEPSAVPSLDDLKAKSNQELGALVQRASEWPQQTRSA